MDCMIRILKVRKKCSTYIKFRGVVHSRRVLAHKNMPFEEWKASTVLGSKRSFWWRRQKVCSWNFFENYFSKTRWSVATCNCIEAAFDIGCSSAIGIVGENENYGYAKRLCGQLPDPSGISINANAVPFGPNGTDFFVSLDVYNSICSTWGSGRILCRNDLCVLPHFWIHRSWAGSNEITLSIRYVYQNTWHKAVCDYSSAFCKDQAVLLFVVSR